MPLMQPVIPGESDLSGTRTDLLAAIAQRANWDRTTGNWTSDQTTDAAMWLKAAVQDFYGAHDWSFLKLSFTAAIESGVESYDLPSDFSEMSGPLVYRGNFSGRRPIVRAPLGDVWRGRDFCANGLPTKYAIEALPSTGESEGQRWGLHFDKIPSQAFEVGGQYLCNPYAITSTRPYPLGGPTYADCLRYAVMAVVERELIKEIGVSNALYAKKLAECIQRDQRSGPTHLGRNLCPKPGSFQLVPSVTRVTYNGTPVT